MNRATLQEILEFEAGQADMRATMLTTIRARLAATRTRAAELRASGHHGPAAVYEERAEAVAELLAELGG